jgi:hypothetical protein
MPNPYCKDGYINMNTYTVIVEVAIKIEADSREVALTRFGNMDWSLKAPDGSAADYSFVDYHVVDGDEEVNDYDPVTQVNGRWDDGEEFEGYLVHAFDSLEDGDHYTDDGIFYYGLSRETIEKAIAETGECKVHGGDFAITSIVD